MSKRLWAFAIGVPAICLALGFFVGGAVGWRLMDERCGRIAQPIAQGGHRWYLEQYLAIDDALERSKYEEAKQLIRRLMRAEVLTIEDCARKPECQELATKPSEHEEAVLRRARTLR